MCSVGRENLALYHSWVRYSRCSRRYWTRFNGMSSISVVLSICLWVIHKPLTPPAGILGRKIVPTGPVEVFYLTSGHPPTHPAVPRTTCPRQSTGLDHKLAGKGQAMERWSQGAINCSFTVNKMMRQDLVNDAAWCTPWMFEFWDHLWRSPDVVKNVFYFRVRSGLAKRKWNFETGKTRKSVL